MDENLSRSGSEAEIAEAQDIAFAMTNAMPKNINSSMAMASIGLLLHSTFMACVKAEKRLAVFDDFAKHIRRAMEEEMEP